MRDPSGEAAIASAWPLSDGAHVVMRLPVRMSYASRFARGTVLTPTAARAGRAVLKLPATYTVLPTTTCCQATPLIWAVGSPSEDTVVGVVVLGGSVSALTDGAPTLPA